ncbi:hypothetical protein R3P38DRAFT_2955830 [Favolaschia claudopus]|uniref:Zinc finger GRF-type domain-containing protein n=1 Tax=Favolaschia claudopus TaxID=2862362 RepID=A0AAW0BEH0_9AGAR
MASYPHEFINCPGIPHRGIVCTNRIPPVLICSGRNEPYHRDLRFNACDECGHFKWLDPELWAAAERRKSQGPAYGAPPDLPPDNPPSSSFTLDPALAYPPSQYLPPPPSQLPALPPSQLYPPPPPPSQPRIPSSSASLARPVPSQSSRKGPCSAKGCTRKEGSAECSFKMCKPCCQGQGKGCRSTSHRPRSSTALPSLPDDPTALSRPPPIFSYQDQPPAAVPSTQPKVYKTSMSTEFAKQYNANHEAHAQRKAAEQLRREQEKQYEHQIRVYFWTKDGDEPQSAREQGIATWPKLNLINHPKLLQKLALTDSSEIDIYDFDSGCFGREDIDHVMEVPRSKILLMRHVGIRDCPQLDDFIKKHRPAVPSTAGNRRASISNKRRASTDIYPSSLKASRLSHRTEPLPRSTSPPSTPPSLSPSSPEPSLSSSPAPSTRASTPDTPLRLLPTHLPTQPSQDPDALWESGRVLNPAGLGTLPDNIYARDMAAAFGMIIPKSAVPVSDRFKTVFQTSHYPKGTWYQQVRAWKNSEQAERDEAAQLPRTSAGLWTIWRARSTGWAAVTEQKRR